MKDDIPKIDVNDSASVKRTLDERIIKLIKADGYEETFFWMNVKLLLMTLACAVALAAEFYPEEFPANRHLLMACVGAYFVLSVIVQLVITFVDKDYIMYARYPKTNPKASQSLRVRTRFPRYQDIYKLTLEVWSEGKMVDEAVLEQSVGKYFTKAGELQLDALKKDVLQSFKGLKKSK